MKRPAALFLTLAACASGSDSGRYDDVVCSTEQSAVPVVQARNPAAAIGFRESDEELIEPWTNEFEIYGSGARLDLAVGTERTVTLSMFNGGYGTTPLAVTTSDARDTLRHGVELVSSPPEPLDFSTDTRPTFEVTLRAPDTFDEVDSNGEFLASGLSYVSFGTANPEPTPEDSAFGFGGAQLSVTLVETPGDVGISLLADAFAVPAGGARLDVLANDLDGAAPIDPTTLRLLAVSSYGTACVTPDYDIVYTPARRGDRLRYEVCDTTGACDEEQITVWQTPPK